jgi:hypothetical protein
MTQERCAPSRKNGCARSQESALELVEQEADTDLVREMLAFAAV